MVSDRLSDNEGGGGDQRPAALFAYTEKFYEVFPYYLAIGMSYEQFWEQDCDLVKYYRKASRIKQDLQNQEAWLQGAYVYEALIDASPVFHSLAKKRMKPVPYRDSPYELFGQSDTKKRKTIQEKHDEKAKAYMEAFMVSINKKFQAKGGDMNG